MYMLTSIIFLVAALSPFTVDTEIPEGKPICTRPFPLQPTTYTFSSTHGDVAVWDSGGPGRPVFFINGNSSDKEIFTQQSSKFRFIALDLPGHGEGYSQMVIELIEEFFFHLQNDN